MQPQKVQLGQWRSDGAKDYAKASGSNNIGKGNADKVGTSLIVCGHGNFFLAFCLEVFFASSCK